MNENNFILLSVFLCAAKEEDTLHHAAAACHALYVRPQRLCTARPDTQRNSALDESTVRQLSIRAAALLQSASFAC